MIFSSFSLLLPSRSVLHRLGGRKGEEGLCDCTPRDHPHNTRYLGVHSKTMGLSLSRFLFSLSLFFDFSAVSVLALY